VPRVSFTDIAEPTERSESAALREGVVAARGRLHTPTPPRFA